MAIFKAGVTFSKPSPRLLVSATTACPYFFGGIKISLMNHQTEMLNTMMGSFLGSHVSFQGCTQKFTLKLDLLTYLGINIFFFFKPPQQKKTWSVVSKIIQLSPALNETSLP